MGKPHVVQIFATLGVSMIIQNLLLTIMSGNYRTIKTKYDALTAQIGDISVSVPRVIAFVFAMVFALLLFWFINKTVTGKSDEGHGTRQNRGISHGHFRKKDIYNHFCRRLCSGRIGRCLDDAVL